jgi:hypothetical protein
MGRLNGTDEQTSAKEAAGSGSDEIDPTGPDPVCAVLYQQEIENRPKKQLRHILTPSSTPKLDTSSPPEQKIQPVIWQDESQ